MSNISNAYRRGLDLHDLLVLDLLLRERSLTRAAQVLDLTQPAMSKSLARLRTRFSDPLFVRAGLRMEPTPKALSLQHLVAEIVQKVQGLYSEEIPFDPTTTAREFNFCAVDGGVSRILPALLNEIRKRGSRVTFRVLQLNAEHAENWLESGKIDFVVGSFPSLSKTMRRQPLWEDTYQTVVDASISRGKGGLSLDAFRSHTHIVVSTFGTGHSHQTVEKRIEQAIAAENIICRVPSFVGAAILAKQTGSLATLPASVAKGIAASLGLKVFEPPIELPKVEIYQYWHQRMHRDPGLLYVRTLFAELFANRPAKSR